MTARSPDRAQGRPSRPLDSFDVHTGLSPRERGYGPLPTSSTHRSPRSSRDLAEAVPPARLHGVGAHPHLKHEAAITPIVGEKPVGTALFRPRP
jgi:hypothetical protein